uniref:dysbindin-like n=1 Tax=Myxine glutinosa TaxID=7769 RepID=UPI00358E5EDF
MRSHGQSCRDRQTPVPISEKLWMKTSKRLLEFVEKQWDKSKQLKLELQQLPTLSSELDAVALSLGKVAALCEEVEAQLVVLEDLCEECEAQQRCRALDREFEDGCEVFR